jgi:ubiquinone/menaquinone biosynthesis C-methylase UbiE
LPGADLRLVDSFTIPWPDGSFDVTWSSMALSSILSSSNRKALFDEMVRVTKLGGVIAVYDLVVRKPTNRDVVAMTSARIRQFGLVPDERIRATPFLPLLDRVLGLPRTARVMALRFLPRTHAVWIWTK